MNAAFVLTHFFVLTQNKRPIKRFSVLPGQPAGAGTCKKNKQYMLHNIAVT